MVLIAVIFNLALITIPSNLKSPLALTPLVGRLDPGSIPRRLDTPLAHQRNSSYAFVIGKSII